MASAPFSPFTIHLGSSLAQGRLWNLIIAKMRNERVDECRCSLFWQTLFGPTPSLFPVKTEKRISLPDTCKWADCPGSLYQGVSPHTPGCETDIACIRDLHANLPPPPPNIHTPKPREPDCLFGRHDQKPVKSPAFTPQSPQAGYDNQYSNVSRLHANHVVLNLCL